MPLIKSGSKKAISANIRAEKAAGKPQDQAVAIALSVARRARKRADGGALSDRLMNESLIQRPPERDTSTVSAHLGVDRPNFMADQIMPDRKRPTLDRFMEGPSVSDVLGFAGGPSQAMFMGVGAKMADKVALAMAQSMARRNIPREQIWNETGWFQGADKKWRFEVPDDALKIASPGTETYGLRGHLQHPEVSQNYPWESARIKANRADSADMPRGWYSSRGAIPGKGEQVHHEIQYGGPSNMDARSAAAHELQHFIQNQEGFARGANPTFIRDNLLPRIMNSLSPKTRAAVLENPDDMARMVYDRFAGEVESRNVQRRLHMTAKQRKDNPPWKTQDIPDEEQMVFIPNQKANGGAALAIARGMARNPRASAQDLKGQERWMEENQESKRSLNEDTESYYMMNPSEDTNPFNNRDQKLAAGGATQPVPWSQRAAAQRMNFPGGMLNSRVPGRTDKLNLNVPAGSYVIPSSVVSFLGQDNSAAGAAVLDQMFSVGPAGSRIGGRHNFRKGSARIRKRRFAEGGDVDGENPDVPVVAAGGEYIVPPEVLMEKYGDLDHAHKIMDKFVLDARKQHIETLKKLPGPAK